jgi:hypothetical protein
MRENSATDLTNIINLDSPALPAGADPDIWDDDGYRDIYRGVGHVPVTDDVLACPLVTAVARQDRSGQLDRIGVDVDYPVGQEPLSPTHARHLLRLVGEAADLADEWGRR